MDGVLLLNKPSGITSHAAVNIARRAYQTRKVGHCGTLDPLAEGILPLMIGNATHACSLLTDHDKTYLASFLPGVETDTEDVTGTVLRKYEGPLPSFDEFRSAALSFQGEILQTPPMYSALKKDGKKLVDLARKGVTVEREPRPVTLYSVDPYLEEDTGRWMLRVHCSRGTYIRTLCADIGKKLGCGGCMGSLKRLSVGPFRLEDAVTPDALETMTEEEKQKLLLPLNDVFSDLPEIFLPPFFAHLYAHGQKISVRKLSFLPSAQPGDRFRVRFAEENETVRSLAEIRNTETGPVLVPLFRL